MKTNFNIGDEVKVVYLDYTSKIKGQYKLSETFIINSVVKTICGTLFLKRGTIHGLYANEIELTKKKNYL